MEATATTEQFLSHSIEQGKKIAREPINSGYWHARDGEEYKSWENAAIIVVNQVFGSKRRRLVCRILEEVWV
jgi:hypothetical protein